MEGDAPSLESFSLPFRQAFLEGLKSPLLTLGCRSGVVLSLQPHTPGNRSRFRSRLFLLPASPGFPLPPAALVVANGLHSSAVDKPWSCEGGHGLLCFLAGQLMSGVRTGGQAGS